MITKIILERERSFLTISHSTRQKPSMTAKTIAHEMGSMREAYA